MRSANDGLGTVEKATVLAHACARVTVECDWEGFDMRPANDEPEVVEKAYVARAALVLVNHDSCVRLAARAARATPRAVGVLVKHDSCVRLAARATPPVAPDDAHRSHHV